MGQFRSVISKLKAGLTRTRQALTSGLRSLILGRRLDEALLADVEKMLLEADVGVAATRRLLEGARDDFRAGKLTRSEDLLEHLKRELKTLLGGPAVEMAQSPSGPTVILVTGINGAGKTTSIERIV